MLKRLNNLLNILMGSVVGVFGGHGIYVYWDYQAHPDLYAIRSAPWYTSILVYGLFAAALLLFAVIIKCIIRKKLKSG